MTATKIIKSGEGDFAELEGELKTETPAAILFFDGDTEVWISKSMLEDEERDKKKFRTDIKILIPQWLAEKKGLV